MTTLESFNKSQRLLARQIIESATNPMVLVIVVAAVVPVLLMGLFANPTITPTQLIAWLIVMALVSLGFGILAHRVLRPNYDRLLDEYVQTLEQVVMGDLRQRLNANTSPGRRIEEQMLQRLGEAVNRMLDRVQAVASEISDAVANVEVSTQEILAAAGRQIQMANEQDTVVTETTATVNEVRATVTETAERAQSVAETAQHSVDISRAGTEAVTQTISGMDIIRQRVEDIADNILVLSDNTQQIGEIIATVNSLADQSRMLALNASVEAARAGEEGKGFAVVALEVRNLADQNREATVQVREILGEIQRATNAAVMVTEEGSKGVDHGQMLVNRAGDSIRELSQAIEDAAVAAMQIAASTRQQTIGMDQLTQAMRTIKKATTETLSSTTQVKANVQNLREAANRINAVLSGLKI
jgi:methyl-accepting chemotaxis protein